MKGFIIDTDTWIEFFHHRSGVGTHISQTPKDKIFTSEVSIAELTYGAVHSKNVEKHIKEPQIIQKNFKVLPLYKGWYNDYAEIRHTLVSQGYSVGEFDIIIAATARHYGLTVVTHNIKHFCQIPGIQCVDWVEQ